MHTSYVKVLGLSLRSSSNSNSSSCVLCETANDVSINCILATHREKGYSAPNSWLLSGLGPVITGISEVDQQKDNLCFRHILYLLNKFLKLDFKHTFIILKFSWARYLGLV